MESLCTCSPFLRGFLPGILVGLLSSVLLFNTLWKEPIVFTEKHISLFPTSKLASHYKQDPLQLSDQRELAPLARKLRASKDEDDCNPSIYFRSQYLEHSTYLLVILVHSTPKASEMRNAVRSSWLRKEKAQRKYLARFVIGTKDLSAKEAHAIACENKQHGDLVLLPNVLDTGSASPQEWSSSYKLQESFQWTANNVKFSYILKCTDSTFAVIDTIVKELEFREEKNETGDFLWGFFEGGLQATKGGRLMEKNWFLCSHFLPFPQGGGYVLSNSLVTLLLSLKSTLQHFEHDDIGLGVWISPFNRIEKRHDVRFNTGCYSRGCQNVYIVSHMETASSMAQKFTLFEQIGHLCEKEFVSRLSYVYNWTAPANRCCVRTPNIP